MITKEFIIAGIKNLLRTNYQYDVCNIDLESEVDSKLTVLQNWTFIKEKYMIKKKIRFGEY